MKTQRWIGIGLALALFAGAGSCGDSPAGPTAGNITVSLVTPNPDDGAVLLAILGPAPTDIQPASSAFRVYSLTASPTEVRVLVVGNLASGPLVTLNVNDASKVGQYRGSLVEVASQADEIRTTLVEYDLTFAAR